MGATWNLGLPMLRKKSNPRSLFAGVAGVGGTGRDGACVASGASAPVVPTGASVAMARAG